MSSIDVDQLLLNMLVGLKSDELSDAEIDALRERFGDEWIHKLREATGNVQAGSD